MRLLFLVEAGKSFGMGHYKRCLALAGAARKRGATAQFIIKTDSESNDWEDVLFSTIDKQDLLERLQTLEENYEWVIADGYGLPVDSIKGMQGSFFDRLMVLDDYPFRSISADVFLNQNATNLRSYAILNLVVSARTLLLGPEFALVTPEFHPTPYDGSLRKVLVTFGSVDKYNRTQKVLQTLVESFPELEVHVILGQYYSFDRLIRKNFEPHCKFLTGLEDISDQIKWADLVISSSGSTAWQVCASYRPLIAVQTIANQQSVQETLSFNNAAICLDAALQIDPFETGVALVKGIKELNRDALIRFAKNGASLVDGRGIERTLDVILNEGHWT